MNRPRIESSNSRLITLAAVCIVVAALYLAAGVLIPFALAMLLSFLLNPLVAWLERCGLRRSIAVTVVGLVVFSSVGGVGWVVVRQLGQLADQVPAHRERIHEKLQTLHYHGNSILSFFTDTAKNLSQDLATTQRAAEPGGAHPATVEPLKVQPVAAPPTVIEQFQGIFSPLVGPLGTAGVVIVLVIFILLQREDLRDRLIRLVGQGKLTVTTQAMDDAGRRVSRYLVAQSAINGSFGLAIGTGLFAAGVPSFALWGFLAGILRFIPYLGSCVAAALPTALAFAVSDGWIMPLTCLSLFLVCELLACNVAEPLLYGHSAGVSVVGLLFAAVFWTWLWGPVGLVLATPLTVCMVVIGKYVPQMEFLNVLLGDEQVLRPEERFYQRLLAQDEAEATTLAEEGLAGQSLEQVYGQLLIPTLLLAEQDHHVGALSEKDRSVLLETTRRIVEELAEKSRQGNRPRGRRGSGKAAVKPVEDGKAHASVVCLPARDVADELAALMLRHVLEGAGHRVSTLPAGAEAEEVEAAMNRCRPQVTCIVALPPAAAIHASYLCRQLRAIAPGMKLLVGLWGARGDTHRTEQRLRTSGADEISVELSQSVQAIGQVSQPPLAGAV